MCYKHIFIRQTYPISSTHEGTKRMIRAPKTTDDRKQSSLYTNRFIVNVTTLLEIDLPFPVADETEYEKPKG